MGSSLEDLKTFPSDVIDKIGYNLHLVQSGDDPVDFKRLKGSAQLQGVYEIRVREASGAYRAVYALNIGSAIYVLHVFQKKSTKGISTPKRELEMVFMRLKQAKELANEQTN